MTPARSGFTWPELYRFAEAMAGIVDELCAEPCWVDRDAEHRGECPDYAGVDISPPGGWCLPCRARDVVAKQQRPREKASSS